MDSRVPNPNKIKKDLIVYINSFKAENPVKFKRLKDEWIDNNEFAGLHQMKIPGGIENLVKIYPGGPNGPDPKDNKEHYSDWFLRNYPVEYM
jgi:hypothetical protein